MNPSIDHEAASSASLASLCAGPHVYSSVGGGGRLGGLAEARDMDSRQDHRRWCTAGPAIRLLLLLAVIGIRSGTTGVKAVAPTVGIPLGLRRMVATRATPASAQSVQGRGQEAARAANCQQLGLRWQATPRWVIYL